MHPSEPSCVARRWRARCKPDVGLAQMLVIQFALDMTLVLAICQLTEEGVTGISFVRRPEMRHTHTHQASTGRKSHMVPRGLLTNERPTSLPLGGAVTCCLGSPPTLSTADVQESTLSRARKSENRLWRRVAPVTTEFAWLPPNAVLPFAGKMLRLISYTGHLTPVLEWMTFST